MLRIRVHKLTSCRCSCVGRGHCTPALCGLIIRHSRKAAGCHNTRGSDESTEVSLKHGRRCGSHDRARRRRRSGKARHRRRPRRRRGEAGRAAGPRRRVAGQRPGGQAGARLAHDAELQDHAEVPVDAESEREPDARRVRSAEDVPGRLRRQSHRVPTRSSGERRANAARRRVLPRDAGQTGRRKGHGHAGQHRDRRDSEPGRRGAREVDDARQAVGRRGADYRRHAPDAESDRAQRGEQGQLHLGVEGDSGLREAEGDQDLGRDEGHGRRAWRRPGWRTGAGGASRSPRRGESGASPC